VRFHIENNSCAAPATVSESDLFIDLLYATELKLVWEGANLRVEKPKTHKPGDRPRNISWKYRGVTVSERLIILFF
jgi:hypothetical protein